MLNLLIRKLNIEYYDQKKKTAEDKCEPLVDLRSSSSENQPSSDGESCEQALSGSSSSSSCSSRHCKRTFIPTEASDWKIKDLLEIGISYDERPLTLDDYNSLIRKDLSCRFELPDICKKLIVLASDTLRFSFDLWEPKRQSIRYVLESEEESITKLKSVDNDEVFEEQGITDANDKKIYEVWKVNILYFWADLKRFISVFYEKEGQTEASFTSLFMHFSRLCLLDPNTGKAYSGCLRIKGRKVCSSPDVRFNLMPEDGHLMLLIVTVVKKEDAVQGDFNAETFSADNIRDRVLAQHGVQLVVEAKDSFFHPRVVGIICIGTKVIFTCLDISYRHLKSVEKKKSHDMKASIRYTRPFDFLNLSDRQEMFETLFWFGYVQSGSYRTFINTL